MKTFSEKLRESRAAAQMSQEELSLKIGVSRRSVLAYEKGEKHPRDGVILKIAAALGISTRYLKDDLCDDPLKDIEHDAVIAKASEKYGSAGARDVKEALEMNRALFAGGELSQEEKDAFFEAVMTAYVTCKENARKKYGRRKKDD